MKLGYKVGFAILLFSSLLGTDVTGSELQNINHSRPNILIIVADDMGYSDLGSYGGEISTPHLDQLAREGVQFSQFHVTPNCAPTRAALLSGMDPHKAGLGTMAEVMSPNQEGRPGYEGYLNTRVVTVAEVLRTAGYHTYMAGKWHLGAKEPAMYPHARGFEETFAMLAGGASHWADNRPLIPGKASQYTRNGNIIQDLSPDFYSTKTYTDRMIGFIDEHKKDKKPFLGYLAYTAPHNPLHAPKTYIDKYKGRYDDGWDMLRENRLRKLKSMGLVPVSMVDRPREEWIQAWNQLTDEQRKNRARDMEIYAAMIDYMDESIGRLFGYLKSIDEYDNTVIIFFSDNGASKTTIEDYAGIGGDMDDFIKGFDNRFDNRGLAGSYTSIGPGWAFAANSPFRLMKGYLAQGGIQVPCIMKLPGKMPNGGSRVDAFTYVIDIMPTVLAVAGIQHKGEHQGKAVLPMQGRSLKPLLIDASEAPFEERPQGFELYGMRMFRKGEWKALKLPKPYGSERWELYNLLEDPAETHDLAESKPAAINALAASWERYAKENGVVEPDRPVGYAKPPKPGSY